MDQHIFAGAMSQLGPFPENSGFAVAVSGGADSMCLSLFMANWCQENQHECTFLTFDHGLRPESREEAQFIHGFFEGQNLKHIILTHDGEKPRTGIQEKARRFRYEALSKWCHAHNVPYLLTAHHFQDQVETFLHRLASKSQIDGLAGMSSKKEILGITLLRPFLGFKPSAFRKILATQKWPWVNDPSNENPIYTRTVFRQLYQTLQDKGISDFIWDDILTPLGTIRQTWDDLILGFLEKYTKLHDFGFIFCRGDLLLLPDPIQIKIFQKLLTIIGGKVYAPNRNKVQKLMDNVAKDSAFDRFTTHGCFVTSTKGGFILSREVADISEKVELSSQTVLFWDRRFMFYVDSSCQIYDHTFYISKLGDAGWLGFPKKVRKIYKSMAPDYILKTLPALWKGDQVWAVPSLNYHKFPSKIIKEYHYLGQNKRNDRFSFLIKTF